MTKQERVINTEMLALAKAALEDDAIDKRYSECGNPEGTITLDENGLKVFDEGPWMAFQAALDERRQTREPKLAAFIVALLEGS